MTAETRAAIDQAVEASERSALTFLAAEFGPDRRPRDIATQLRRRRAASYRLPPLPGGRHDPMDPR